VGILKTLGFSSGEILGMVVGEASLIALIGGLIGCLLAIGLCAAIGAALQNAPGFLSVIKGMSLSPLTAALTLAIALLLGLASSLVPGLSAARISILDALRYDG
jgi:putative ABC transport system permease protein